MSNFRTHNIVGGTDGLYVTLFDTTSDADYTSNDVNITTGITGGTLVVADSVAETTYTITLSDADVLQSRATTGLVIPVIDFTPAVTAFPDAAYLTTYTINSVKISNPATSVVAISTLSKVFYGIIDIKIRKSIVNTSWKLVYSGKSIYYDNALKLKSWFDNMKVANDFGFVSEASRLLAALKKVVV